jgi:hypothetical protein
MCSANVLYRVESYSVVDILRALLPISSCQDWWPDDAMHRKCRSAAGAISVIEYNSWFVE